jgi:hypothetical protein
MVVATAATLFGTAAPAHAATYPRTTRSIYEHSAYPPTVWRQGCDAGSANSSGLIILDFGRPAFDWVHRVYGTYDFGGHVDWNSNILKSMEAFARGYAWCLPKGSAAHISLAWGTNNSCSNQDPRCCPHRGCRFQPPRFETAGRYLAMRVNELHAYLARTGLWRRIRVGAADDAEPAWDPAFTNTSLFLRGYAEMFGYAYPMWDFGSLEPGYWTPAQEYAVAYGFEPDIPVPEIYYPGLASEWESLSLWAVANRGRPIHFAGVTSQYVAGASCGYSPREGYDALLAALRSHASTYQASVAYLTDIPCGSS